jgi:hypothetical protein
MEDAKIEAKFLAQRLISAPENCSPKMEGKAGASPKL